MTLKPSEVFYIVVGYFPCDLTITLIQSIDTIIITNLLLPILQLLLEINYTLMNYTISFQVEPKK